MAVASIVPPTATCNNATLRMARWTDASDLALVRDWFYPHKIKTQRQNTTFDPYAPVVEENMDATEPRALDPSHRDSTSLRNANKRRAIERVETYTWHDHHVPHALLATASLIDAQLHYDEAYRIQIQVPFQRPQADNDTGLGHDTPTNTDFKISTTAMKSILAMSFCRFVNGFVDRDVARSAKALRQTGLSSSITNQQDNYNDDYNSNDTSSSSSSSDDTETDDNNDGPASGITTQPKSTSKSKSKSMPKKGTGESSMYKHAASIGMPTSFVDLRHKATHARELPGMHELVAKTNEALDWLWEKWWKVHVTSDSAVRMWEVRQWDEALSEHRKTMQALSSGGGRDPGFGHGHVDGEAHSQGHQVQPQVWESATALEHQGTLDTSRWEIVTENGVTRFDRVKGTT